MKFSSPIHAFLKGWIPAVVIKAGSLEKLEEHAKRLNMSDIQSVLEYPCLQRELGGYLVFFQTEEQKERVMKELNAYTGREEQDMIIGLALGYPPKAANWHVRTRPYEHLPYSERCARVRRIWDEQVSICYGGKVDNLSDTYSGITFYSSVHDMEENVRWVWENTTIPADYMRVTEIEIPIGYTVMEGKKHPYHRTNHIVFYVEHGDHELLGKVLRYAEHANELHDGIRDGKFRLVI